jgi:hypothetical protein
MITIASAANKLIFQNERRCHQPFCRNGHLQQNTLPVRVQTASDGHKKIPETALPPGILRVETEF